MNDSKKGTTLDTVIIFTERMEALSEFYANVLGIGHMSRLLDISAAASTIFTSGLIKLNRLMERLPWANRLVSGG